jgi:DNA-binding CsgD family transcriptional regulator
MAELRQRDYREGWRLVCEMAEAAGDGRAFARLGTGQLPRLVASEITTLSVCDLVRNTRSVVSSPGASISAADRAAFDRHFAEHPLVRFHSSTPGSGSHRISDSLSAAAFRETPLYNDYYRRVGIDHAIAVPLYVDRGLLVSFVLNRNGRDFSDREKALLDLVREPLAALYRHALSRERSLHALPLTAREREVLEWLAAGKTDRQIAEILGMSPRTVQKHLQHIYEKLGVETRTAAVMRALGGSAGTATR